MIDSQELIRWLKTLPKDANVAVDDGGLTLVEVGDDGKPTNAYLEVGGVPLEGDND